MNKKLQKFLKELNIEPNDAKIYFHAFVHRSYLNEHPEAEPSNERLEFLGDSVIGLAISEIFYKKFIKKSEGFMSKKRAGFVNEEILASFGKSIHLDEFILLGKGEKKSKGAFVSPHALRLDLVFLKLEDIGSSYKTLFDLCKTARYKNFKMSIEDKNIALYELKNITSSTSNDILSFQ